MDRAKKAGLTDKDIFNACKGNPSYVQSDGRLVYDVGKNIYIVQNPYTKDFIGCISRKTRHPTWRNWEEESEDL